MVRKRNRCQPTPAEPLAGPEQPAQLAYLYAISKSLSEFESIAETLPAVIALINAVIPLHTVALVEHGHEKDGQAQTTIWQATGGDPAALQQAASHAQQVSIRLGGPNPPASVIIEPGLPGLSGTEAPAPGQFLVMPLIGGKPLILGVLQIEGARPLQEDDLTFIESVASQLATALGRFHAQEHERSLRRHAEGMEEQQKVLLTEARSANKRFRDLLAIVSHDLRNPLTIILLNVDLLKRSFIGSSPTQGIENAAKRMKRLVDDLLDWARTEGGQLSLQPSAQPLAGLAAEAVRMMRPVASERGLRLRYRQAHDLPLVSVDRERMLQVLENLIGNALKFTPAGGTVTVSTKATRQTARIAVSDTGPGIAAEQLPLVFTAHWQAERTYRQGAGLGLAIAKGIVEAHGGTIRARSKLGVGSTFTVDLPALPPQSQTVAA